MDKTILETLKKYLDTPEGKAETEKFFNETLKKNEIQNKRFRRFESWLLNNDFDKLMYRLILEHDEEYIESCYHKGLMPYPNNKLSFIVDYVLNNLEEIVVTQLDCDFHNVVRPFKGYFFQHIDGQGTILRIYNKDDKKLILQL